MKNKILIAALACASVAAFAQSSTTNGQASSPSSASVREVASGKATGKTASQPAGSNASLSSSSSDKVTAPRDIATGQASGKRQYQPVTIQKVTEEDTAGNAPQTNGQTNRESSAPSVSEVVVTKTSASKTTAQDDWQTPAKTQTSNGSTNQQPRVATGDVNGDGKADAAINNSHSNIKNSKDVATGQASGKRQHEPVTFQKEVGTTSPSK
jgi:hypothetical protein